MTLSQDELKVAIQEGIKSADTCTRFCTYGSQVENGGYEVFHNSTGPTTTDIQRIHAAKTLALGKDGFAKEVQTWVAGLHKGERKDLNALMQIDTRGPVMTGWPWTALAREETTP